MSSRAVPLLPKLTSLFIFISLTCRMDAMVLPLYVTSQASASCQFPSLNLSCRVLWRKTIQDYYPLPSPALAPLQVSLLTSFLSSLEQLCKPVSSFLNLQPVPLFTTIPPAPLLGPFQQFLHKLKSHLLKKPNQTLTFSLLPDQAVFLFPGR